MKTLPVLFFKSHIDTYTRKDGSVVNAHDDKRQASMFGEEPSSKAPMKRSKAHANGKKFIDGVVSDYDAGKSHPRHNAVMARAHISSQKVKTGMSDDEYDDLVRHFNSHVDRAEKENRYDKNADPMATYKKEKWAQ